MVRISIDTGQVRSLGQVLQASASDLRKATRQVRTEERLVTLNTFEDPTTRQIAPDIAGIEFRIAAVARQFDRLGADAIDTVRKFEAADAVPGVTGRPSVKIPLPRWCPGRIRLPLPSRCGPWNTIYGPHRRPWPYVFNCGVRPSKSVWIDRRPPGLVCSTTNVGKQWLPGTRGIFGCGVVWGRPTQVVKRRLPAPTIERSWPGGYCGGPRRIRSAWSWCNRNVRCTPPTQWGTIWNGPVAPLPDLKPTIIKCFGPPPIPHRQWLCPGGLTLPSALPPAIAATPYVPIRPAAVVPTSAWTIRPTPSA